MKPRYYVGPKLLGDIRRTVSRVDSMSVKTSSQQEQENEQFTTSDPRVFRVAERTGSWSKGTTATLTWTVGGAVTDSMVATNLFADITSTATYSCAVARAGNTWYLIAAECQ